MSNIPKQLKLLPDEPGIYFFYNANKELMYVGKATSLRDRVRSYFLNGKKTVRPIESKIHEVMDIKWQETESVLEAIIAEANAIKKYQPKYNVDGKDDKSWNYIVITDEEFPRVLTVREREMNAFPSPLPSPKRRGRRRVASNRCSYMFGPYPGLNWQATMKLLRKLFRYSTCQKEKRKKFIGKPCLYYQIGLCLGVCTGEITPQEYKKKVIRPLATFLSGRKKQVLKDFEQQMKRAVKAEEFEEAARLRDQISSLQRIQDIALLNKGFFETLATPHLNPLPRGEEDVQSASALFNVIRIEGYDISNLGATGKVGSMVTFVDGEPDKDWYRRFKIRTVAGQSDVDCLEEVLRRRLRHANVETLHATSLHERDYWPLTDVILIDGGKPQVNRAVKVLKEFNIYIPIVGIAKGPERKRNDFFFGNRDRSFVRWVAEHKDLLIRVRNEAHRFAVSYQRILRRIK